MKKVWIFLFAGVALGELIGRYQDGLGYTLLLAAAVMLAAAFLARVRKTAHMHLASFLVIFLVCITIGNIRIVMERSIYEYHDAKTPMPLIRRFLTQTDTLDELSLSKSCSWTCRIDGIVPRKAGFLVRSGQVNIYCDDASELKIGNTAEFSGQMSRISGPRNPGEWDYAASAMASGVTHRLYARSYTITDADTAFFGQKMYEIRTALLNRISSSFRGEGTENDIAFLRAALLGDKSMMSDELYEMYKSNGIAHLLAISGLHVSIIGMSVYRSLSRLIKKLFKAFFMSRYTIEELSELGQSEPFLIPEMAAGVCSTGFLAVYSMLTGSSVSTVRAVFMMVMVFLAAAGNRTYDLLNAAALAGLCIILRRPFELFNCSFLLSFGAVAAIGGPASYISKRLHVRSYILNSVITSLCIQAVTLPIASAYFFEISTYGLILNLIVIPLMTYVVWSGLAAMLIPAAGGAAHYLLSFFEWLCAMAAKLPYKTILLGRPAVLAAALLAWTTPFKESDSITFLDVGQGDGIYMYLEGEHILVDGGSTSSKSMGEYTLEPFLKSSRVDSLDRVFVTHADSDHISGIRYLLTQSSIDIKRLYLPVQAMQNPSYEELIREASDAGVELIFLKRGDMLLPGREAEGKEEGTDKDRSVGCDAKPSCSITCLWPRADFKADDVNDESLVLLVQTGAFSAYLAGDAGTEVEAEILREESDLFGSGKQTDVLKCGHHGSRTSSSYALIEALKPRWAVLSYKKGNSYGHPHQEVTDRLDELGIKTVHTAQSGAITYLIPGNNVKFCTFLDSK